VARVLVEERISGLPVVDGERVVGVVSEADILFKEQADNPRRSGLLGALALLGEDRDEIEAKLNASTAGEAMSSPAVTITEDRPVAVAAAAMLNGGINRLPVVDAAGRLIGIVTRADLVRAFIRSDEEIAREIREDVILHTLWIAPGELGVTVTDGNVRLSGKVGSRSDAFLLTELVRRVPGVVSVSSDLTWERDDD
jgi:CBS domain-containing protein